MPTSTLFQCEMCRTNRLQQQKIDAVCMILVDDAPDLVDFSQPISEGSDNDFP